MNKQKTDITTIT